MMSRYVWTLVIFFLSFQLHARPLNSQEQLSLLNFDQSLQVMKYMVDEIDPRLLTFRQRLGFEITKRACSPVQVLVDSIKANEELEDQSQNLLSLMYGCLSGVVNLSDLYRLQTAR